MYYSMYYHRWPQSKTKIGLWAVGGCNCVDFIFALDWIGFDWIKVGSIVKLSFSSIKANVNSIFKKSTHFLLITKYEDN